MKGNRAILQYLYADGEVSLTQNAWADILQIRERLHSKNSASQYIGFANAQRMRLTGARGMGRHGQRTDLVEKYGYDTTFAMHYIRLLFEGKELLSKKQLRRLPLPEKDLIIKIRTGGYTEPEMLAIGSTLDEECQYLLEVSDLPEVPDRHLLSTVIAKAYRDHWDRYQ
jgi:hypothetical protein